MLPVSPSFRFQGDFEQSLSETFSNGDLRSRKHTRHFVKQVRRDPNVMGRANGSLPGLGGSAVEEDAPKVHGKTNEKRLFRETISEKVHVGFV